MLTLLHGDNTEASRAELVRLRTSAKDKEVRILDGKKVDTLGLTQALESSSLFGNDLLIVIENLLGSFGKKTKNADAVIATLLQASTSVDVILWEDKEVSKTMLDRLGKSATIKVFSIPVIIFQFLDGLRPHGATQSLHLFQTLMQTEPSEVVFTMIVRRIRQLIMIADGIQPEKMQGWQASRLTSQAKLFTMEQLVSMHTALRSMEYSLKTGSTPFALKEHIEQFIINL